MKILHMWNTAGVPSNIAKNMDYLAQTESFVLAREQFTPYHETYGLAVSGGKASFYFNLLSHMGKGYDIIHIHDVDQQIRSIKALTKAPIIIHYHGSKIRKKWMDRKGKWSNADRVIVSTKDLMDGAPDHALHITDPVDIQLIEKIEYTPEIGTALYTDVAPGHAFDLAEELARKHDLRLITHSRDESPLKHEKYLSLMSNYEYFIDVRREYEDPAKVFTVPSLGALEALEMGLKVIRHDGEVITNVPFEWESRSNTIKFYRLYLELLK